jgi:hypothetical protein
MPMIRIEGPHLNTPEDSLERKKVGFLELISEQDAIRERIEEIKLQINSLNTAKRSGQSIDEVRLESLEENLNNEEARLEANEIELGKTNMPEIAQ